MEIAILVLCVIIVLLLLAILLLILLRNVKSGDSRLGENDLQRIEVSTNKSVNLLSDSISKLVAEKNSALMSNLDAKVAELTKSQGELVKGQNSFVESLLKTISENEAKITKTFNEFATQSLEGANKQKDILVEKISSEMKSFNETVSNTITSFNASIKEKLDEFKNNNNESIKALSETVNKNLESIRKDNGEKLEKINQSVNEKLQQTLEEKLKDSFKSVVEGIGDVNKAVGEIKGLATDVGSLKNVLTNVKTKGIMGEVILGNILKEFLTAGQFDENVATKRGSSERVEFAIKLPGRNDDTIYLPVDSKFPYEPYSVIHESSDVDAINEARKNLRSNLLKYAKDVSEKYIDVPNTTDFAVIFLPLEGLYLEALNMGLFEEIQAKYKVNLTGPTTFTAFINSLNMGFRSLMIEKKSADVFKLLGAVKTEFAKFADALEKTQKKVNAAADELDDLVGKRTRMMNSKLKNVDALDEQTSALLLGSESTDE